MAMLFSEIGFLILFAAIGGALAIRFKQPAVLGLLFMGMLAGPGVLGLVTQSETISVFAEIGAVLLLFTIGIEFSVSKLLRSGLKVLAIAVVKLGFVFFLSFQLAGLLGLNRLAALHIAAILAITSTALMVRIINQKNLASRPEVQILVGTLIVEDVFAVFFLTLFSSIDSPIFTGTSLLVNTVYALALFGAAYLVLSKFIRVLLDWLSQYQSDETMAFAALGLGVGLSYLAEAVGLSASIGAFLAGSLVASLPRGEELTKAISPFAFVFSSIFFLSMGLFVSPQSLIDNYALILILIAANLLFKFAGTSISTFLFGFSSQSAVFSGLAMLSVGEFSLLIAASGQNTVGFDLIGVVAALVFVSALINSIALSKLDPISSFVPSIVPSWFKRRGRSAASRATAALDSLSENATRLRAFTQKSVLRIAENLAFVGVLSGFALVAWFLLRGEFVSIAGFSVPAFNLAIAFLAAVTLLPVYNLFKLAREIKSRVVERINFGVFALTGLFLLFIVLPLLETVFSVSLGFSQLALLVLVLAALWWFFGSGGKRPPRAENVFFFKDGGKPETRTRGRAR
ncbi:MAG: cation:proton antiporter [Candidatus Micrarchaeota archaeon]